MDLLTWLIVGLVAGVLAGLVVGGIGLIGNIVVGIVGAFVGGWIFAQLGVATPFAGLAGTIFTAFVGAVVLLLVLHLITRRRAHS
ncbi:MAG: GlsB/YeaQ/YmgE family stress response membrane protein [Gemmatimonadota bacterium]